jgi:tetratricopeptide (TPR) repeat protein
MIRRLAIVGWCSSALGTAWARSPVPVEEPPPWQLRPMDLKLDLVRTFLDSNDPERALDFIAALRREGLDDPTLDLYQGIALRDRGMSHEAEGMLQSAAKRMGRDARPHAELCVLYADTGAVADAVEACTRATRIAPDDARAWNNLGFLLLAQGQAEAAVEANERALEIDSGNPRFRNNLAFALAAAGRWDDAERTFRANGSEADTWYNLGVARSRALEPERAAELWQRALILDPNHADARAALETRSPPSTGD